jgi:hypothetical protein
MTRITRLLLLAVLLPTSTTGVAGAQELPKFDPSPTCRAEASAAQSGAGADACIEDEQKAHEQLSRDWAQFAADIRTSCTGEATDVAGVRSYVELITCLQIARAARKLPTE